METIKRSTEVSSTPVSPPNNQLDHPALIKLLKKAYSAEKAAAYAYQGHAGSVRNKLEKISWTSFDCIANERGPALLI